MYIMQDEQLKVHYKMDNLLKVENFLINKT